MTLEQFISYRFVFTVVNFGLIFVNFYQLYLLYRDKVRFSREAEKIGEVMDLYRNWFEKNGEIRDFERFNLLTREMLLKLPRNGL